MSTDEKPMVATYGCGPCIALGGYDPTNKMAFVVHFASRREVLSGGGQLFYRISQMARKKIIEPIQLHLRGGESGYSESIIAAIRVWMKRRDDLPMKIVSADVLGQNTIRSLPIDSRDGRVSTYDPLENPHHRNKSAVDDLRALTSAYKPRISLAYLPVVG